MTAKKREPTGKERMRRAPPKNIDLRPKRFEFDVKKAYDSEQLTEIGAITLVWNQLEAQIEYLPLAILSNSELDFRVRLEFVHAANSLDKILGILRKCYETNDILNEEAKKAIEVTFSAVLENRFYRNGIVHSMVYDHEKGIVQYVDHGRRAHQILVTLEALNGLYQRLVFLRDELIEISTLYRLVIDKGVVVNDENGWPEPDQRKALRERAVPEHVKRLLDIQKKRQLLPPLPEFPDAHLISSNWEDVEIHASPEERH